MFHAFSPTGFDFHLNICRSYFLYAVSFRVLKYDLDTGALSLNIYTARKATFTKDSYEDYFDSHVWVTEHGGRQQ